MNTNPKKILIIDDELAIARTLGLKLTKNGYIVKSAMDGLEGLAILEKESFDLIILDLIMPKMDGFTFAEKLKEKNINIPIVIASNISQEEDINRIARLGIKEYFIKTNTSIATIVEHIKKILG